MSRSFTERRLGKTSTPRSTHESCREDGSVAVVFFRAIEPVRTEKRQTRVGFMPRCRMPSSLRGDAIGDACFGSAASFAAARCRPAMASFRLPPLAIAGAISYIIVTPLLAHHYARQRFSSSDAYFYVFMSLHSADGFHRHAAC